MSGWSGVGPRPPVNICSAAMSEEDRTRHPGPWDADQRYHRCRGCGREEDGRAAVMGPPDATCLRVVNTAAQELLAVASRIAGGLAPAGPDEDTAEVRPVTHGPAREVPIAARYTAEAGWSPVAEESRYPSDAALKRWARNECAYIPAIRADDDAEERLAEGAEAFTTEPGREGPEE